MKNLPYDTDERGITEVFRKYGPVKNVRLSRWHHTGLLKGFGYVDYGTAEAAGAAMKASQSPDGLQVGSRAV